MRREVWITCLTLFSLTVVLYVLLLTGNIYAAAKYFPTAMIGVLLILFVYLTRLSLKDAKARCEKKQALKQGLAASKNAARSEVAAAKFSATETQTDKLTG